MNKKFFYSKRFLIFFLIFLAAAGGLWYRFFYLTSPARSIERIVYAGQQQDTNTVQALVDIPAVSEQGYDGLSRHNFAKYNAKEFSDNPFIAFMKYSMKTAFLPSIERTLLSLAAPESEAQKGETKALTHQLWQFDPYFTFTEWRYKEVQHIETHDRQATVTVLLHNTWLDADVRLPLSMEQIDSFTWKVSGIADMELFLQDLDMGARSKLAAINRPIQTEIDHIVSVKSVSLPAVEEDPQHQNDHLIKEAPPLRLLKVPYELQLHTANTPIKSMYAVYELTDSTKKIVFSGSFVLHALPDKDGTLPSTAQFLLSPIFASHKALMETADFSSYTGSIHIQKLELKNGTILELEQNIPLPSSL